MNAIKWFMAAATAALALGGCKNDDDNTWSDLPNSQVQPITVGNRVIYEANVYSYSNGGRGDFKGIEKDLPRLKELGVDILWLMPIHPIGEENRQGTLGSPYGVRDYKAINPDFGTEDDFRSLIAAVHAQGMELWMDWVANHTAWDHVWVKDHIDYYATNDQGERPYSPPGWNDAIQLDHSNPGMRAAMIDAMQYWVREFDIDGFRCDAADYVPLDFWREVRRQVDAVRKVTWLAEGSDPDYMEVFDYNYAWEFADALKSFGQTNDVPALVEACKTLHKDPVYRDKGRMVYLTNHDLSAFEGTEFTRFGSNVLPLTVLTFTIFDMPLIYSGQEIGMDKSLVFSEVCPVEWDPANKIFINLFKKLTQLKRTNPALEDGTNRGSLKIYPTTNENVFAYSRVRGDHEVLVILNLGNYAVQCRFEGEIPSGTFKNYLNNTYEQLTERGIPLRENGYAIYVR